MINPMIWRCPNCNSSLQLADNSWRCAQGHSFDKAKQGYANLLLPNQKSSSNPGDSQSMMQSRRRFLQAGYYRPLAEALAALLDAHANETQDDLRTLLDIGCGEGYYLRTLSESSSRASAAKLYGLDISREAIKRAATALPSASFCVASSYRLPVHDHSVDVVLQVFAPGDDREVQRVLATRGLRITASPGPRHLYQLKEALYQHVREHQLAETPAGFGLLEQRPVRFAMQLNSADAIADLLAMTPLAWRGSPEGKQQLLEREALDVEADFVLQVFAHSC